MCVCAGLSCCLFRRSRILQPWTDVSLGNCSYLDTCRQRNCKYVHYQRDPDPDLPDMGPGPTASPVVPSYLQVHHGAWRLAPPVTRRPRRRCATPPPLCLHP